MNIRKMLLMFIIETLVDKEWGWHYNHKRKGVVVIVGNREVDTDELNNDELWELLHKILYW